MKHPEITWSLMHPTPLDPDYVRQLTEKAKAYHVDSFEICGQCHAPSGGMDGLIDYREFPAAFAKWDQAKVAENRRNLTEILSIAHAAGKPVYLWHREVMVPPGLLEEMPELLDENREFDLLGDAFARLIRYKLEKTFESVPGLDGLVLTLTEADYSAIHNSNTEKYPPVEVVKFIIGIFASELARRNKRFIMRSFGSIAQDYRDIIAGAEKVSCARFEIETKITPYDFDPFLPDNPFLRKSPGFTLSAECDCLGEFMGQGNMPFEQVDTILRYVRAGQAAGVDRFTIRLDRRGNRIFDLYELNYYAYDRAMADEKITADEIRREWYGKHAGPEQRDVLAKLGKMGWEMVCKTYYIDRQVLFHGNYCMKYLQAAFVFPLFGKKGASLANGKGIWSILTDRTAPGRAAILAEKDRAVQLADEGLALIKTLKLPAGDYRNRLWENATVITRSVRELCRCIAAYFDDMERKAPDHPQLTAQLAGSLAEYDRLAGHAVKTVKTELKNVPEHRLREAGLSVEEVVIEPLAAICRELPAEYEAEFAARAKFLKTCVDGIITGGVTDDGRIARYMHGSHSGTYNGLPSRWAGNRVFPNGFLEMELGRGKELVIYGAPEETPFFTLACDGKSIPAEFDAEGKFTMPLPAGTQKVHVRLSKRGAVYPRFYAVVTRNDG